MLQFFDLLALYFNRIHPSERTEQTFEHVPLNAGQDASVTLRPQEPGVYEMAPYPFAANAAEFAFAGRRVVPGLGEKRLAVDPAGETPTSWERFRLVAA